MLYRRSETGVYWFRFQVRGKEHRRSTGTRDHREAVRIERAARIEAETAAPAARRGVGLAELGGLDGERGAAKGVSDVTIESIVLHWSHLCRVLGAGTSPDAITYEELERYMLVRRSEKARGQTIRRELQALKRGLRIARRKKWIHTLPVDWPEIRNDPARASQAGKLHPSPVLARWLAALAPDARDQAELVLRTGLRATEVRRLLGSWVEDVEPEAGVPFLLRVPAAATKGRRERIVGLTDESYAILERRALERGLCTPLLGGYHREEYETAAKRIGYAQRITLRDLRHTYATWAAHGTGDAAAAQAALGHKDLRTTQRYLTSTVRRTAGASVAVAAAWSRHNLPAQREATNDEDADIHGVAGHARLVPAPVFKAVPLVFGHLLECDECAGVVASCMGVSVDVLRSRHSEPAQRAG